MTQGVDDPADLRQRHPVDGLRRDARRHGTGVVGDPSVGKQEQFGVEQLSITVLQQQSSPAAIVDDPQDGFGVSHLAYLPVWVSGHLPPFPVWTAFPSSEYYGGSLALRLAARRAIPHSRGAGRVERDGGASFPPLSGTMPHPPPRGGLERRRFGRPIAVAPP